MMFALYPTARTSERCSQFSGRGSAMRTRTFMVAILVALAVSIAWASDNSAVRVINVANYDLGDVRQDCVAMPLVITNFDELYNAVGDDMAAAEISGQVDF